MNRISALGWGLIACVAFWVLVVAIAHSPTCAPGDKGIRIGHMLVAGCP